MSERKSSFFAELKRRHVDKVALVYAVVSWLLIEAASILLPTFDSPAWVMETLIILLVLGFIVAVIISWSFEMTPEGMKRTADVTPGEVLPYWSKRKFATFVIGVAVLAFGLLAYQLLRPRPAARLTQSDTASIPQKPADVLSLESPSGSQAVEQTLRDLDAQWSADAGAKDLEKTVSFYSEDAIVMPPNASAATSNEAIRKVWQDVLASAGLVISWKTTKVEVAKSGDLACLSGTYELAMNDGSGKPVNDRGKYVEVWEKQADGRWKCGTDIWNSDLAAAPSEKK